MVKIKVPLDRGPLPLLGAFPTVIVGTNTDGKPDFTTVAWAGVATSKPPSLTIALQHHRHSLKGIRQNMMFSINIPSVALVRETDYCGLVSGARADKVTDCRFTVFFGELKNAPFIEQCPINHSCEAIHILNLGSHELIVGRIVETYISEECLTNGRPDPRKINPILLAERKYWALGDFVADAFHVGIDINPRKKMDSVDELQKVQKINKS